MRVLISCGLENLRLTKNDERRDGRKDCKCDKMILHSYQLLVLFSIFSLILLYKIFIREECQLLRSIWGTLNPSLKRVNL